MAFSTILDAAISVGSAVKRELWLKVKNNLDDLDTRLNNVEVAANRKQVWEFTILNGSSFSTATGLTYYEATQGFTITSAFVRIFEVGTITGFLEIDILRSTTDLDSSSFTSIFTTKPKIDFSTASDYEATVNQVFDVTKTNISVGDFLRLDITITPTSGVLSRFMLNVYGE